MQTRKQKCEGGVVRLPAVASLPRRKSTPNASGTNSVRSGANSNRVGLWPRAFLPLLHKQGLRLIRAVTNVYGPDAPDTQLASAYGLACTALRVLLCQSCKRRSIGRKGGEISCTCSWCGSSVQAWLPQFALSIMYLVHHEQLEHLHDLVG